LFQNYPNPFNPGAIMEFYLSKMSDIELNIYNMLCHKIKILISKKQTPGTYSIIWDGEMDNGMNTPSGMYFYRLKTHRFTEIKKNVVLEIVSNDQMNI